MLPASLIRHSVEFSGAMVRLGTDAFLQSTLLIALGLLVGWVFRARGAAVQSVVYRITLTAALACPLVATLLSAAGIPGLHVKVLMPVTSPHAIPAGNEAAPLLAAVKINADRPVAEIQRAVVPRSVTRPEVHIPSSALDAGVPQPNPADTGISEARPPLDWPSLMACLIAAVWLLGTCVLAVRLLLAWRLAVHLRQSASPADPQTMLDCRALAQQMGVCPPVVLRSPFATSAALVGLFQPAILLPEEEGAAASSREILVHELAHLARRDLLWKLLGRVGTALFFFQPLLWLLVRRMVVAAEEVCDDYVLEFGCDRRGYARQLFEVAQRYQPAEAVGVGMISLRSWVGRRVARILDSSRQLSLRAGRRVIGLALAISLATTIMVGLFGIAWGQATAAPANRQAQPVADGPKKAVDRPSDRFEFRGQVLDPDGKPLPGANICIVFYEDRTDVRFPPPKVRATTGRDGHFRFAMHQSEFDLARSSPPMISLGDWHYKDDCCIVAQADGYGPVWQPAFAFESGEAKKQQPVLRVVKDDVPLTGRIVDTKGRPVAGVKVQVRTIMPLKNEDLSGWLAAAEKKDADMTATIAYFRRRPDGHYISSISSEMLPQIMPTAVSDAGGKFRMTGIGRERIVELSIEGPGIETPLAVHVRTRPGPVLVIAEDQRSRADVYYTYYGSDFVHVARPSVPIIGTVRDTDSGKPLPGVMIQAYKLSGNAARNYVVSEYLHTKSDDAGRYHLTGMPIGKDNELLAVPPKDQPYLLSKKTADTAAGKDFLQVDFALKRGVWIRGRITDAKTGAPIPRCAVDYFALLDNPNWKSAPGFEGAYQYFSYPTDKDGRYALPGLPGRGIVAVQAWADARTRYPLSVGAEKIPELGGAVRRFDKVAPTELHVYQKHAMAAVNPAESARSIDLDFRLDPGRTLSGSVLDAAGQPLAGAHYSGWSDNQGWKQLDSATFTINYYRPDEPRKLLFVHMVRKLSGSLSVQGVQTTPLIVRLQPWGTITGRVVDAKGHSISGVEMVNGYLPTNLWVKDAGGEFHTVHDPTTDQNGRFRIEGLAAGMKYALSAWNPRPGKYLGKLISDVSVESGQTKDLGDLQIKRPPEHKSPATPARAKKAPATPATSAAPAAGAPGTTAAAGGKKQESRPQKERITFERPRGNGSISGKVVSATTGKPVARAEMYLFYVPTAGAIFINTGSNGTFVFKDIPQGPFALQVVNTPGYQDARYNPEDEPGTLPQFRLANGEQRSGIVIAVKGACRVSGRILDEKGKVPEQIDGLSVFAWFENDASEGYDGKVSSVDRKDGSYWIDSLSGKPLYVMAVNLRAAKEGNAWPPIYYPGTFSRSEAKLITFDKTRSIQHVDFQLRKEGGLILAGTVRDEAGKPVPEAFVVVHRRDMNEDFLTAYTDSQGHYLIQGLGDGEFLVHVDAVHRGLVRTRMPIDLDKTSKEAKRDFTLARGATISGKLVDENGHDWQVARSLGRAIVGIGMGSRGDFTPIAVDFRNKYRPKNCDGLVSGSFNLGKGDYTDGYMVFPTKSTFILQGMLPGYTRLQFFPQKEGQKVLKILYAGQDILDSGIDTKPGQEIKDVTIVIGKQ